MHLVEFYYFIKMKLWREFYLKFRDYFENEELKRNEGELKQINILLRIHAYALLRLHQLDPKILFKKINNDNLEFERDSSYDTEFYAKLNLEIDIIMQKRYYLLNLFNFSQTDQNLQIIFRNDEKTLLKIISLTKIFENEEFLSKIQNSIIIQTDSFVFLEKDNSPRHLDSRYMTKIWSIFRDTYKEHFKVNCIFDNPSDFKSSLSILNSFFQPFDEPFNIISDYVKFDYLEKFGEDIKPPISTSLFGMFVNINKLPKITSIGSNDRFCKIIQEIAYGFHLDKENIIVPSPYGLKRAFETIGPNLFSKLDNTEGITKNDIFCKEIEFLAYYIKRGLLPIQPNQYERAVKIKIRPGNVGILISGYNFTLKDGTDGEIDIIAENNHRLFLIEAKKKDKGRINRSYIKNKSPLQCDKYVKFISEGYLEKFLKIKGRNINDFAQVNVLVVTSSFPDFYFVQSKETHNIYSVLSYVEFLRYFYGYTSILENLYVDEIVSDLQKFFYKDFKNPILNNLAIYQIKFMLITYRKDLLKILTKDWRNLAEKQKLPKFKLPEDSNVLKLILSTQAQSIIDWYFKDEPNWLLKIPRLIHKGKIPVYLRTQLGNTHIKLYCSNCDSIHIFYHNEKQKINSSHLCDICKNELITIPDYLRQKYITNISIALLMYKSKYSAKRSVGDFSSNIEN